MDKMNESGQAVMEYILLLCIVIYLYSLVVSRLADMPIIANLSVPFTTHYKYTYQYGHPQARGSQDSGGPRNIPQFQGEEGNFRIFINPPISP